MMMMMMMTTTRMEMGPLAMQQLALLPPEQH
jgi:hypothetical protein